MTQDWWMTREFLIMAAVGVFCMLLYAVLGTIYLWWGRRPEKPSADAPSKKTTELPPQQGITKRMKDEG